jgi:glycosyltransferase involved in cell wall biosynthesis
MRLLFVSAYYPPPPRGGYEELCREVAEALVERGHELAVITSGAPGSIRSERRGEIWVQRRLHLEVESGLLRTAIRVVRDRRRLEADNVAALNDFVTTFEPDAALIWGMWNIPRSVPARVEELLASRVAYYLCDYWPTLPSAYVQQCLTPARRRFARIPKRLMGMPLVAWLARAPIERLRFEHPVCVSAAEQRVLVEAGVHVEHARVIYGNARCEPFVAAAAVRNTRPPGVLRLLFAGRLSPEKGIDCAIRALALLGDCPSVQLDIVGSGEPAYVADLVALTGRLGLDNRVSMLGSVPRSDMPATMAAYDALVFPSEWDEPFARIVLEAMAARLIVVGTPTGGTSEVLIDGETGLTFPRGDPAALAQQLRRVLDDPARSSRLAETAQRRVVERFTFERTVEELERYLLEIASPNESLVPAYGR